MRIIFQTHLCGFRKSPNRQTNNDSERCTRVYNLIYTNRWIQTNTNIKFHFNLREYFFFSSSSLFSSFLHLLPPPPSVCVSLQVFGPQMNPPTPRVRPSYPWNSPRHLPQQRKNVRGRVSRVCRVSSSFSSPADGFGTCIDPVLTLGE